MRAPAGAITDDNTADVTVTNNANFSGTAITLNDTYAFGSLTFNSAGAVTIVEADATSVTGTNTAQSLVLTSGGALTNAASSSLTVTNNASLTGTSVHVANAASDT